MSTSVTLPNIPKYSLNFSELVCQLKPPTNNFPGAGSELFGVERPDDPECDGAGFTTPFNIVVPFKTVPFKTDAVNAPPNGTIAFISCSMRLFVSSEALEIKSDMIRIFFILF